MRSVVHYTAASLGQFQPRRDPSEKEGPTAGRVWLLAALPSSLGRVTNRQAVITLSLYCISCVQCALHEYI